MQREEEDHHFASVHDFIQAKGDAMTGSTGHGCEGAVDEDVTGERLQLEDDEVEGKGCQRPDPGNN